MSEDPQRDEAQEQPRPVSEEEAEGTAPGVHVDDHSTTPPHGDQQPPPAPPAG